MHMIHKDLNKRNIVFQRRGDGMPSSPDSDGDEDGSNGGPAYFVIDFGNTQMAEFGQDAQHLA